nr:acyl-CoA thioester hydrolase/BAAT C-terminal domain-containing protein [Clostridium beijerinckii]
MELLRKAHFKHEYKHITYEKSGHMLTVPYQSIYPSNKYPDDIDGFAKANINCWNETINFINKWSRQDI